MLSVQGRFGGMRTCCHLANRLAGTVIENAHNLHIHLYMEHTARKNTPTFGNDYRGSIEVMGIANFRDETEVEVNHMPFSSLYIII